ncbi:MAG: indole-3-glycerol phosphate synthase TrpC [Chloroflexi bacterium]|nr:indole-3-glycerol phosphate synthase TrpC [Chloroflexota bacterium]
MDILERILESKREELRTSRRAVPLSQLKEEFRRHAPRSLSSALKGERVCLIAEVKKASPSKGVLSTQFDPVALARTYAENGAAAISILTDGPFFGGSLEHLKAIRNALGDGLGPPLLRKDFIFDPYQVHESRAAGADAFLLIVLALEKAQLQDLQALGQELGMEALVEVRGEEELTIALEVGASLIGINNRDLRTFQVDVSATQRLMSLMPGDRVVVSESGIRSREDMEMLGRWGVKAALVGEALVTAPDVAQKVRELA